MADRTILCINDHVAELDELQTEQTVASLPEWRREAARKFRYLQGQRECAVGYVELLRGLRLCFGISEMPTFAYNEHGKPFLKEYPNVHFSISHCKEAVGCLVADHPCGLDIEYIRKAKPDLVRHTMSEMETEIIFSSLCPDISFTRFWTQKEAVLKLKGTGIVDDLHSVLHSDRLQNISLKTIENPYRGYVFTIATQSS